MWYRFFLYGTCVGVSCERYYRFINRRRPNINLRIQNAHTNIDDDREARARHHRSVSGAQSIKPHFISICALDGIGVL